MLFVVVVVATVIIQHSVGRYFASDFNFIISILTFYSYWLVEQSEGESFARMPASLPQPSEMTNGRPMISFFFAFNFSYQNGKYIENWLLGAAGRTQIDGVENVYTPRPHSDYIIKDEIWRGSICHLRLLRMLVLTTPTPEFIYLFFLPPESTQQYMYML